MWWKEVVELWPFQIPNSKTLEFDRVFVTFHWGFPTKKLAKVLSRGEKQRCAFCRLLLLQPKVAVPRNGTAGGHRRL